MSDINKVIIRGRAAANADWKDLPNTTLVTLRVGTSDDYTDRDGRKVERTDWHMVACWGQMADQARGIRKGDVVQVEGERRFRVRSAKPRVFFQEWDEPLITGIRWVTELVEVAGGVDIFPEFRTAPMAKDRITTAKEVLARNPDVIIGSWCGKPMERTWIDQHLGELACVRAGNVHEIDSSIILQPGPALFLEGVDALARAIFNERLHP
jgi:hypothetical protein